MSAPLSELSGLGFQRIPVSSYFIAFMTAARSWSPLHRSGTLIPYSIAMMCTALMSPFSILRGSNFMFLANSSSLLALVLGLFLGFFVCGSAIGFAM